MPETNEEGVDIKSWAHLVRAHWSRDTSVLGHSTPRTCRPRDTSALGHSTPRTCRPRDMSALGHSTPRTCRPRDTSALGHSTPRTCRPRDTSALGHIGPGAHLSWYIAPLGHVGLGTHRDKDTWVWDALVSQYIDASSSGHTSRGIRHPQEMVVLNGRSEDIPVLRYTVL